MKFNVNNKSYWSPTPKIIKKIADSVLAGAVTIATFAAFNDHTTLATVVMIVAGIAKILSNFFSENETN